MTSWHEMFSALQALCEVICEFFSIMANDVELLTCLLCLSKKYLTNSVIVGDLRRYGSLIAGYLRCYDAQGCGVTVTLPFAHQQRLCTFCGWCLLACDYWGCYNSVNPSSYSSYCNIYSSPCSVTVIQNSSQFVAQLTISQHITGQTISSHGAGPVWVE